MSFLLQPHLSLCIPLTDKAGGATSLGTRPCGMLRAYHAEPRAAWWFSWQMSGAVQRGARPIGAASNPSCDAHVLAVLLRLPPR